MASIRLTKDHRNAFLRDTTETFVFPIGSVWTFPDPICPSQKIEITILSLEKNGQIQTKSMGDVKKNEPAAFLRRARQLGQLVPA